MMQLSDFLKLLSGGCWGDVKTERSKLGFVKERRGVVGVIYLPCLHRDQHPCDTHWVHYMIPSQ